MSTYRLVVLLALDEVDAERYRPYVNPDRVVLTAGAHPAIEGLRVTAVVQTPRAFHGRHYQRALATLRRSLALMPRDVSRQIAMISGVHE